MKLNKINILGWLFAMMILVAGYSCSEESLEGDIIYLPEVEKEVEEPIAVTSIAINPSEYTLTLGSTVQLSAEVEPVDADITDGVITWDIISQTPKVVAATDSDDTETESDATPLVTISEDGLVTAEELGIVTIQATLTMGEVTYPATTIIEIVEETIPVKSLSITNKADVKASYKLEDELTLTWKILPATASNQLVRWSSEDTSIASVNAGVISFNGKSGEVWIYAQSVEDMTIADSCKLTIIPFPVTGVTVPEAESASIMQGTSTNLTAQVTPENASNKDLVWTLADGDEEYATIREYNDGSVTVTALEFGGNENKTVTATATSAEDDTYSNSIEITITPILVTDIEVSAPLGIDVLDIPLTTYISGVRTITFTAVATPELAGNKTIVWSSDDENIAEVDSATGEVTIKSSGVVAITATSTDGTNVSDAISLIITSDALSLDVPELTYPLSSDVIPAITYTGTAVGTGTPVWSSSDESVATVNSVTGEITTQGFGEAFIKVTIGSFSASATIKVPGGWFRELFKFNHFDSEASCSAMQTAANMTTGDDYYFYVNSQVQWMNYDYVTNYNETAKSAIGDETTGGYLQFYSNGGNRCVVSPTDKGFEKIGFNKNYPFIALHTEAQGYNDGTLFTTAQSGANLKIWTCKFASESTMTQKALYTYKSSATDYSNVYYFDLSAYLAEYADDYSVNKLLTNSTPFFRRDPASGVNVPIKIFSIQTFATLDDLKAYADSYNTSVE